MKVEWKPVTDQIYCPMRLIIRIESVEEQAAIHAWANSQLMNSYYLDIMEELKRLVKYQLP